MKLSMKSRYGLRALIDLAINSKTEQVALNSIAERNKISPQYLEQVFASLRKAGIVKSIKGSQGGYFLSRPPQEITVSSIIEALEGDYRIEDEELPKEGKYIGTITEGDLLWFLKDRNFPDLKLLEDMPITSIERRRDNQAVKIDESMENLFDKVMNQNFVPVVDDKRVFIGIVTRKDVLAYLGKKAAAQV